MNKAYGVLNRPVPVPVEDVTRVLAFEDDDMVSGLFSVILLVF